MLKYFKREASILFAIVFATSAHAGQLAQDQDAERLMAAARVIQCLEAVGDYLYLLVSDRSKVAAVCEAGRFEGSAFEKDILGKMVGARGRLSNLSHDELERCRSQWHKDIQEAAGKVLEIDDFSSLPAASPSKSDAESEQAIGAALEARSLLDQAITGNAMEDGSFYGQYDGKDCTFPIFIITAVRADNIAFLLNSQISSLYMAGRLPESLYRPLWFMVQHADLQPWYQELWLALLSTTWEKNGFPERLVDSLRERVELARKRTAAGEGNAGK